MRAHFFKNAELPRLLEANDALWGQTIIKELAMDETPMGMQPTEAVRAQWKGKKHGLIDRVRMSAAHNGKFIAFRLEWDDPVADREITDTNEFTDAAAIMLPSVQNAPILLMGMPEGPVNAMYWRADEGSVGRNIISTGFGTTRTIDQESVVCRDRWSNGMWTVIIARPLILFTPEPVAQLQLGGHLPYGVAVWAGSNQERAGVKSFTLSKEDLAIDPVT